MSGPPPGREVLCAGALVFDAAERLLVVRRGQEPEAGRWSVPGGRVEPGEDAAAAAVRETAEETGLRVHATRLVGSVRRPGPGGVTYVIHDWACDLVGGTLHAADDAVDARFVSAAGLAGLPLVHGLLAALSDWGALPR